MKVTRSQFNQYAVAVLAVVLTVSLQLLLNPLIPIGKNPWLLFFAAILVSAWYGGLQSGIVTTVLSAGAGAYLISVFSRTGLATDDILRLGLFLLEGGLLSAFSGRRHVVRRQLQKTKLEALDLEVQANRDRQAQEVNANLKYQRQHSVDLYQQIQQLEVKNAELVTYAAQMQTVLDNTPVSIYIVGIDGYVKFTNAEYDQVFGQRFGGNLVGRHLSEFLTPEAVAKYLQEHQEILATRKTSPKMIFETELALPDGVHTYLRMKFPLQNANGQVHAFCSVSLDVTVPKQMEAALKNLEQQLQHKDEEIAEVSRIKLEFLTRMSHELRTLLTSILSWSSLLLEQISELLTVKQQEYLSLICSNGQHLLFTLNDLLDLARIEAGRMELNLATVDLAQLCQQTFQIVKVQALAKQQRLSLELPVAIDRVIVDHQRTVQMLLNYLSTAVKFTKKGGAIALSTQLASGLELATQSLLATNSQSFLNTTLESRFLVLSVSSTGIGMPLEKQHLLFHKFHQIDEAIDLHDESTDLGLILTRQLAELHGGTVTFSSIPEVGSTFSIWLPLPS